MRKHTTLLLTTWGILTTIIALYFWNVSRQEMKMNTLLTESIALHKKAIANEAMSYSAINDCFVVNRGLCNPEDFKTKLQNLGDDADRIYTQISILEKQIN